MTRDEAIRECKRRHPAGKRRKQAEVIDLDKERNRRNAVGESKR